MDNFDDRYLGAKASDPALDNDGNALLLGALYFNTTDGVMKVYTASGWIAASSASVATLATFEFVATSGQTVFSGNDANGSSLSYVAPAIIVTLNGVRLRPGDDYTATNGTSITLVSAAALNDELVVDAFGSFLVANTYTIAQADALLANKLATSAGAVGATNLASDSVTTIKIANNAVTAAKVESGALVGPVFYGRNTSNQAGNGGRLKYAMNSAAIDTHSGFNSGSNRWTVPSGQGGNYVIDVSMFFRVQSGGSINQVLAYIYVNNLEVTYSELDLDGGTSQFYGTVLSHSRGLSLSAGDYVEVFFNCPAATSADARASGVMIQRIR